MPSFWRGVFVANVVLWLVQWTLGVVAISRGADVGYAVILTGVCNGWLAWFHMQCDKYVRGAD